MTKHIPIVAFLALPLFFQTAFAHPTPDIPVRSSFGADGSVTIRVEVDPRCFAADPLNEPYLENALLQSFEQEKKAELFLRTEKLIMDSIEFWMYPVGQVLPDFKMKFSTFSNKELTWNQGDRAANTLQCAETPVVITAEWKTDASRLSAYQIKAKKAGKFSIRFINELSGQEQPLNVLFPGEASYKLDLTSWAESVGAKASQATKN